MPQNKYYGDTGVDQLDTGGNPIFTFLSSVLNDGEVLGDDGKAYSSIQTAQDNASGFIILGPGSFSGVTVDTADFNIVGSGTDTLIDGGSNIGIDVTASNVALLSLNARSNTGSGSTAVSTNSSQTVIRNVEVEESGNDAFSIGPTTLITNSGSLNSDGQGIEMSDAGTTGSIITSNIIEGTGGSCIFKNSVNEEIVASDNILTAGGNTGVGFLGTVPNNVLYGNRIINPGTGFDIRSDNNIIAKNRVSGATTGKNDQGTNNIFDDNEPTL